MSKLLVTIAAIGLAAAMAAPASAHESKATGVSNMNSLEVSAARRLHHWHHFRHHAWRTRHRWHPHYGFYGRPYYSGRYAYGYDPYYRPGPRFYIGPGGFSFGWL